MKTQNIYNQNPAYSALIMKAIITGTIIIMAALALITSNAYALNEKTEKNDSKAETLYKYRSNADGLSSGEKIELIFSIEHTYDNEFEDDFMQDKTDAIDPLEEFKSSLKKSASGLELPPVINEAALITRAFMTNFALHELGHRVVADYAGATNTRFNFLKKENGVFFLGQSTFDDIDDESKLSFSMAGEAGADMTFEHALRNYRKDPTLYNKSLMFFSGTDFLWYCLYAFYLSDGHPHFDPVAISNETGLSKDTIFTVALTKTMINAYRVYSGRDYVIPYFAVNKDTATLNFMVTF